MNLNVKPVSVFDVFVNLFFPPLCWLCDTILQQDRKVVCQDCFATLERYHDATDEFDKDTFLFSKLFILFEFNDPLRTLIHLIKYQGCTALAEYFAREALEILTQEQLQDYSDIVAVPLHQLRLRERGYNQSGLIAAHLARLTGLPVNNDLLFRERYTHTQTQFDKQDRIKNIQNAFRCTCRPEGRRILLIDDVITTGSTVNECCSVLLHAGAASVDVLALANPRLNG